MLSLTDLPDLTRRQALVLSVAAERVRAGRPVCVWWLDLALGGNSSYQTLLALRRKGYVSFEGNAVGSLELTQTGRALTEGP